ncbi:putative brevis radix (BRX) domain-containing protein [Lupinus albus]|uniref:Putative brevis radix (BRX) domain-containing protein n=1 Tax=Lupinus albus TaxID=3870 RepID=A0A6A4PPL0_LUPAL|nr:putative brevis radix (BRX) domain-containing protein [Lupinus albus]
MFTCISSKKQINEEEREEEHESGSSRSSKSLTAQMKELALKVSRSLHLKSNTGSIPITKENIQQHEETVSPEVEFSGFQTTTEEPSIPIGGFPSFHVTRPTSTSATEIMEVEEERFREWTIEVDDGVHMTFQSLPDGGNTILRIRFSHEKFSQLLAQRWWIDNYEQIITLYNIRRPHQQNFNITPPSTHQEVVEDQPLEEAQNPTLGDIQDSPTRSISFREWLEGMYTSNPNEGM